MQGVADFVADNVIGSPGREMPAPFLGLDVFPHVRPRCVGVIDHQLIIVLVEIRDRPI
jgi:hypothetical protein